MIHLGVCPKPLLCALALLALCAFSPSASSASSATVRLERLPEGALQPQTVATPDGVVHLIYLTGSPKAADIVYRHRTATSPWSAPLQVNSQPGSAIAIGTIRGAQIATGRSGQIHILWNGSSNAKPAPPHGGVPLLYSRLNATRDGFEPQRNLMRLTHELDGGGSIAADAAGNVYAVWQASPAGVSHETNRAVYLATSKDDGQSFSSERIISLAGAGACGCCGLTAFGTPDGQLHVLYRAAATPSQRDMTLLSSADPNTPFQRAFSDPWPITTCPMSSATIAIQNSVAWAAWESNGRIHASPSLRALPPIPIVLGAPNRNAKHPRAAINKRGETLLVWTEGTGWQRGGSLAWQLFTPDGKPADNSGRHDGIPAWSFAAPYANPDDTFTVLY